VYTIINDDNNSPVFGKRTNSVLPTPIFTPPEVRKVLAESNSSSSCGPDGCPPIILKKFPELCTPLCDLFNMSLQQGSVPKAWKVAKVIPIYKGKGSALDVKNYRPISLTNVFCKTLERLIRGKIVSFLQSENLLSPCQSGFRAGLSTLTQLSSAQDFIIDNLNQLRCVDGIYTDLSKAFDTISHNKLLTKLQAYGFQGHLLSWIKSFLTDRYHFVSINSSSSTLKQCISGLPQGSVLSPILFLLFINDLPDCIKHSSVYIYADDAKLLKSINCQLDCILLQQDLDAVATWCSTWQLTLNVAKCFFNRFGLANKPLFSYTLTGTELLHTPIINDLGVAFDSKLDFSSHCHKVAAKGFARANMLLKCFYTRDRSLQCKLFATFVRPILEYNSPIWSPHFAKDIKAIERVQKYFTKHLKGLQNKTYKERLSILKLPSLECRRAYADMIFLYKIIHGMSDPSLQHLFPPTDLNSNIFLRRHPFQLFLPKPRSDLLKFSFRYRAAKLWNTLPEHICKSTSIAQFKKLVMTYLCEFIYTM
jgi:hypothetical protein